MEKKFRFKTTLKCSGCVSKVTPFLNDGMERGFATSGQGADGYVEDRRYVLGEEGVRERGV